MRPKLTDDTLAFFKAILSIDSIEECEAFFDDVCTIKEIQDISQRFAVACLLDSGEKYHRIEEMTGASTATISRVNKSLTYGSGGYRTVLDKINKTEKKEGEKNEE